MFLPGGSQAIQYTQGEADVAAEQARESGVWLNCHAQFAEVVKSAARNGFRAGYHCTYSDEKALDLLEARKDDDLYVASMPPNSPRSRSRWWTDRGAFVPFPRPGRDLASRGAVPGDQAGLDVTQGRDRGVDVVGIGHGLVQ